MTYALFEMPLPEIRGWAHGQRRPLHSPLRCHRQPVIDLTGTNSITLTVGQSSIKIDDEGITLVSADGQRIKLN
jgi:hypothetical protein